MKRFFNNSCAKLFALFCVFALSIGHVWAGGGYTVNLTASANPNDAGTVYVVKVGEGGNNVSAASASYTGSTASSKSAYEVFAVYANAKRGKKFTGWSNLSATWTASGTAPKSYVKQNGDSWVTDTKGAEEDHNPTYIQLRSSTRNDYYNLFVVQYDRAESTTGTITANFGDNDIAPWYVQYLSPEHGTYTVKGPDGPPAYGTVTLGGDAMLTYNEDQIELNATPATGYAFTRYIGEDEEGNVVTLGEVALKKQTIQIPVGIVKVSAEFTQQPFLIGERTFANLDAALQAVKTTSSKTILLLQDGYTVPAGNYTIPSGVTLLIPKSDLHVAPEPTIERVNATSNPSKFRKLILASGVNINVSGTIELGGTQGGGAQGATGAGIPTATYGQLQMNEGSKITLNNGAVLRSWGFVTGKGEIDARRGSVVYEQFQNYDWKGGSNVIDIIGNSEKVFPVNTYFIQNIESPVTYHPGSKLMTVTCVYVSDNFASSNSVQIVGVDGDIAMFLMDDADTSEDTWVRKWYDTDNDFQVYEINSSARLGSMEIYLPGVTVGKYGFSVTQDVRLNSADYVLPVTSNLKIHLLTGEMGITQSTVMLPGAEIEINKTATVKINAGQSLYLYDSDQWGQYVFQDKYANQIKYAASVGGAPNKRTLTSKEGLGDAKINVHGTFEIEYNSSTKKSGAIYTTAGGANIFSTVADAGTIQFTAAAPSTTSKVHQWGNTAKFVGVDCPSAWLKNDAGSVYSGGDGFSETAGTAAGKSFCFIDIDDDNTGEWVSLTTDGCFVLDETTGIYYAKPSDYVALQNGKTPNADHTYSSADGSRTFILICDDEQTDCQWWEVTYHEESGLYYCEKNGIYYFFDEEIDLWVEKRYTISWLNYDGNPVLDENNEEITYFVPYGSMPKYNNSTPTRQDDPGYYTYDFVRWTPDFTPVTSDVSYTAEYEKNPVMYTITWLNASGSEREVGYFQRDVMPVCRTEPAGMGTSWEWSPVVEPVTGNAIYQLTAIETPKTSFTVTWKNYNGTTLQTLETDENVQAGTTPTYNGSAPTKDQLDDVEFIWNPADGWTPAISPVTADIVYMAKYTEQPITYAITWKNGDETLQEQNVSPNTVPQYTGATPTKPSDETYNYAFSGWDSEIVAATEDAIYTAQFSATPKDKTVSIAETIDGGTQQTVTNLTITSTGQLTIPSTSRINATNLILEGTNTTSGQLITNSNTSINVTGEAYFDWTPNGASGTQYRTWYAVAVPWEVNAETGIFIKDGRHLVLGSDFDLVWYDGEERAANGDGFNCWKYVEYETDKIMHPGKSYMMYFGPTGIQTVRFAKASGSAVIYNSPINVETYDLGTGVTTDANWNGIANPRTYYVSLGTGASFAQVLGNGSLDAYFANPEAPVYTTIDVDASKFIVGQPLFVQAVNPQPVVVKKETSAGIVNAAPRRARTNNLPDDIAARYAVHIALDGHATTDNLFIQVTEEEKEDAYVLGQDLSKGGVAKTLPQLWVNRYNAKLSVNTQSLTNDVAEYPLTIFAPKSGEYVINTDNTYDDYDLYLTMNGEAVWNLSNGEYTFSLSQGNTTEYGLRVSAKSPAVATGVDEALVDAQGDTKKVLINDQVLIIRGENVYTIDGQLVK